MVTASIHQQLHGLNQYYWEGWDDAAGYFLANKINLEEALKDEDQSIQAEERYDNLMNKSHILEAMGRKDDADVAPQQSAGQGQRAATLLICAPACREKRNRMRRLWSIGQMPRNSRLLDFAS